MRLIDADKLKEYMNSVFLTNGNKRLFSQIIDNAPTVEPDEIQAIMKDYLVFRCEPDRPQSGQVVPDTLQGWRYDENPH